MTGDDAVAIRRPVAGSLGEPPPAPAGSFAPSRERHHLFLMATCVLIVDDERDIRDAIAELLSEEGYEVHGASDGAEALTKARDFHPGLVLLDLMMPGMDGWEFRDRQRVDPELAGIPVVVLSALGRVPGVDAAAYLQKPFELDDLLTAVRVHAHAA